MQEHLIDSPAEVASRTEPLAIKRHRVVILGGGFGGLLAAKTLRRAPVQVTLVDKRNFHRFQPLLYQVATGSLAPGQVAAPLRGILRKQKNTRVLLGEAVDIDPASLRLRTCAGRDLLFADCRVHVRIVQVFLL